ncbi:MAG: hypothetical protein KDD22_03550, partial [Bdellovibrionales bacterium]|nr:hypothetical protein [Bdellovibrionales bacterium]
GINGGKGNKSGSGGNGKATNNDGSDPTGNLTEKTDEKTQKKTSMLTVILPREDSQELDRYTLDIDHDDLLGDTGVFSLTMTLDGASQPDPDVRAYVLDDSLEHFLISTGEEELEAAHQVLENSENSSKDLSSTSSTIKAMAYVFIKNKEGVLVFKYKRELGSDLNATKIIEDLENRVASEKKTLDVVIVEEGFKYNKQANSDSK